jgi:hypothetical protein
VKRLVLVLAFLASLAGAVCAMHRATVRLRREVEEGAQALLAETQSIVQARTQLTSITEKVRDLKRLQAQQSLAAGSSAGAPGSGAGSSRLSPDQSEQLLSELGFNWASSGDYLMVSKDTLRAISLKGVSGRGVSQAACEVLAITPAERQQIEAAAQSVADQYKAWALTDAKRTEPSGDVVAQYSLPQDRDFSLSLSNSFVRGVVDTLGEERGSLLLSYSGDWMTGLGMFGGDSSLTVKRYQSGDEPHLTYVVENAGNSMSSDVSPQNFPEAFRPLFPNGWTDLAAREGFALPKAFQKGE